MFHAVTFGLSTIIVDNISIINRLFTVDVNNLKTGKVISDAPYNLLTFKT